MVAVAGVRRSQSEGQVTAGPWESCPESEAPWVAGLADPDIHLRQVQAQWVAATGAWERRREPGRFPPRESHGPRSPLSCRPRVLWHRSAIRVE